MFAWLLVHRLRLAWLEEQVLSHDLDQAIVDRRAEAGSTPTRPTGRPAPRRSRVMSDWGYVAAGLGHHRGGARRLRRLDHRARPRAVAPGAARGTSMDVTPTPGDDGGRRPSDAELDLSPRTSAVATAGRKRRWAPIVVLVLVLGGVGFVAAQALTTATTFFYNADEAVAKQAELGTSRFRLQGTVEPGTIEQTEDRRRLHRHVQRRRGRRSHHVGDPPELFKDARAGRARGPLGQHRRPRSTATACSIKHDANYTAKNSDRIKEADEGGTVPPRRLALAP